ncbi:10656_t:CDS:2 [Funneliformis geosporum]|nr:10656_t:CDS:2 [Funneliformis geosporum]
MEEFLLTREPLDIIRISTALFVRIEKEDIEQVKKLQSFGTGKQLAKRVW